MFAYDFNSFCPSHLACEFPFYFYLIILFFFLRFVLLIHVTSLLLFYNLLFCFWLELNVPPATFCPLIFSSTSHFRTFLHYLFLYNYHLILGLHTRLPGNHVWFAVRNTLSNWLAHWGRECRNWALLFRQKV